MALKQTHVDDVTGEELNPSKKPYYRIQTSVVRVEHDESFPPEPGKPSQKHIVNFMGDYASLSSINEALEALKAPAVVDPHIPEEGSSKAKPTKGDKKS